jgi:hypothetical protein
MLQPAEHLSRTWLVILATALVPLLCLAPFVTKPFHMDDLTYVWPARQIHEHPLDFYGFTANWYGVEAPMSQMNKNPPLVSYYIALAALILGWSEIALHVAFLVPALAVSLGTYVLARSACTRPHLAALAAVLTPAFLVSSTNVMCDTLMLAFYVWAAALWVDGLDRNRPAYLALAVLCISLASLTKYFGISLVPLLLTYSLARERAWSPKFGLLFIPLLAILAYDTLTFRVYGTGLLGDAASYATMVTEERGLSWPSKLTTGLSFTGGCVAAVACYAPALWPKQRWGIGAVILLAALAVILAMGTVGTYSVRDAQEINWALAVQLAVAVAAGVHLLILASADLAEQRDSFSLLLFLWIAGTFVFTTFLNWSTNGRTVLPMVPAAGILVMRRLDSMSRDWSQRPEWVAVVPLIPAACLALIVAWADYSLAGCQRTAATSIQRGLKGYAHAVWFQGHWGFQYYMEALGAKAIDFSRPQIEEGDVVVVPFNNTNKAALAPDTFHLAATIQCMPLGFVSTVQKSLGAGFYSDRWGPLPFAAGRVMPEKFDVFLAGRFDKPEDAVKRFQERLKLTAHR